MTNDLREEKGVQMSAHVYGVDRIGLQIGKEGEEIDIGKDKSAVRQKSEDIEEKSREVQHRIVGLMAMWRPSVVCFPLREIANFNVFYPCV